MISKTNTFFSAILTASLGLAGCGPQAGEAGSAAPGASTADRLAQAAGPGAEVKSTTPGDVFIVATLPKAKPDDYAVEREAAYVGETAVLAKRLAQAVQGGAGDLPAGAATLGLLVLRPDLDRLGNVEAHSFMSLEFAVADLKAARIKRLGAFGVLNLATAVQVVLPWQTAVKPWCETHVSAPDFCLKAQASVAPELWEVQG